MAETPLAQCIPLWRTLRETDTTVLVTPALDYVGALELGGVDVRFASEEVVAGVGEALRSLLGGLEDSLSLLFLQRVCAEGRGDLSGYEEATAQASSPALLQYATARTEWLKEQPVRRARLFLFFSKRGTRKSPLERGHLGMKLLFQPISKVTAEFHGKRVAELSQLRDRLTARLAQIGIASRELRVDEVRQLHEELLNPNRAARGIGSRNLSIREDLFSERFIQEEGEALREYSEAEQLCLEDVEDARSHFRQGNSFRRVLTLKVLPEHGTDYFIGRALQELHLQDAERGRVPFPYTLAVAVNVEPQGLARWKLNTQHRLVEGLRGAVPFLAEKSVSKEVEDAAKQQSITSLFVELNEMASKVVTLSVSLLLEAGSLEALEGRTVAAEEAFAACGNSGLLREEVSQLPAFLSMFPGSGPYQLRKKGCTSRNAADFLPLSMSWTGGKVNSLLLTPGGEFFRFALFDKSFGVNAHHGLVAADTGSGKSFAVGMFVLDALACGLDAILVDNGNSWRPLTELMGGIHIPVDLSTSICPFMAFEQMVDDKGELDVEAVSQVVRFIEICVTDEKLTSFDNLFRDVVARAVTDCYRKRFRARPTVRPLLGDFRIGLRAIADDTKAHAKDREIAAELHLRLRMFCEEDGLYAKMLNRPSTLRFDSRLLTFEMEKVSKDPLTKRIAMAAIMEAVSARAASRRNKTLVAIDEAHEYLGKEPAAETFLAGCYAKMRKYDVAMWTISQQFSTFANCRVAPTIIDNSSIKLFLWHSANHQLIGDYFKLPRRAVGQFASLERKPGRYSDAFLIYGKRMATVRLAPNPLAYWILTTDGDDKRLLEKAAQKNPSMSRLKLLHELAERYPFGAQHPPTRSSSQKRAAHRAA
jgi:hypothetical protein